MGEDLLKARKFGSTLKRKATGDLGVRPVGLHEDILRGPFSNPDTWYLMPCFSFLFFHHTVTGNPETWLFFIVWLARRRVWGIWDRDQRVVRRGQGDHGEEGDCQFELVGRGGTPPESCGYRSGGVGS